MIWIFVLGTGLVFGLPPWWWAMGFILAVLDADDE